jgi:methylthioribose-1-phosphate isomerase
MQQGRVDAVIVGCDRVAANADVANKIGTLLKALAARDAGLPFWVACPTATLDLATPTGQAIRIEMRPSREITHMLGRSLSGEVAEVALMAEDVCALNPAFDVTPARLVNALITERGCIEASESALRSLMASGLEEEAP